jgi:hypothetical protein
MVASEMAIASGEPLTLDEGIEEVLAERNHAACCQALAANPFLQVVRVVLTAVRIGIALPGRRRKVERRSAAPMAPSEARECTAGNSAPTPTAA